MSTPAPLPFYKCQAHPGDALNQHLLRVAQRAAASIAPTARPEIARIAFIAGLFHDLGKATPWFQQYLNGQARRSALTHHGELGAILSWWYSAQLDGPLWQRLAVFSAVRRHHGALRIQNWPDLFAQTRSEFREPDSPLRTQLAALDSPGIANWLSEQATAHPQYGLPVHCEPPSLEHIEARVYERDCVGSKLRRAYTSLDEALATLSAFGALLAVDKTDAALSGAHIARQALPADAVSHYKRQIFPAEASSSPLNQRREHIAKTLTTTWLAHLEQPLLTFTAPTGAGKTLSVLHAALQVRTHLAKQHGHAPRLIYCLPFTAVIDQNHAVIRAILKASGLAEREDILLKHHHLSTGVFRTGDDAAEHQPDGAGQLLTETWQSEIIVTTFHQLLHSLLSPCNANLKRAGQLSGAILVLDEVQALPLRYWEALRQLFKALARTAGTRILLMTATRPLIFQPGDALELLPDHAQHFQALNRTRLHLQHHNPLPLTAFAGQLIAHLHNNPRPTLIIVNRRKAVSTLFHELTRAFPQRPCVALSTHLTPRDRRARIRLIQRLQRQGQPVIVISTQLIEAGVDLSFPVVHRDLAPLDALIQSAGRCNRHGEQAKALGEVYLWQLATDPSETQTSEPLWRRIYDAALIEVTCEILGHAAYWDERDFLELSARYFSGCRARQDQQRLDEHLKNGDLAGIERDFQLIEETPSLTLFIHRTPKDQALWQIYRNIQDNPALSPAQQERALRPYRAAFRERIIQIHANTTTGLDRDTVNRLDVTPETYHRSTGFIKTPGVDATCIL